MINLDRINYRALATGDSHWLRQFAKDNNFVLCGGRLLRVDRLLSKYVDDYSASQPPEAEIQIGDPFTTDYQSGHAQVVYIRVKLPYEAPRISLDSKSTKYKQPVDYSDVREVELEGDFTNYFRVFLAPNYHLDILQFLTPDVMQALVDFGSDYEYDLEGRYLKVRAGRINTRNPKEMRHLLEVVARIAPEFIRQVKVYHDHRAERRKRERVAPQGLKFKSLYGKQLAIMYLCFVWLFIVMLLLSGIFPFLFEGKHGQVLSFILVFTPMLVALALAIYVLIKKRKVPKA